MIAIIMPSRGLIHSRTIESVLQASQGYDVRFFFSHNNPIPDCFNLPVEAALQSNPDYIWIVEEDMEFPADTLDKLMAAKADIAAMDYHLVGGSTCYKVLNGVQVGGTGCVLIKASVMQELMPFTLQAYDQYLNKTDISIQYGGHDIDLFVRAHEKGYKVAICGMISHLKVTEYGTVGTNNGCHTVVTL